MRERVPGYLARPTVPGSAKAPSRCGVPSTFVGSKDRPVFCVSSKVLSCALIAYTLSLSAATWLSCHDFQGLKVVARFLSSLQGSSSSAPVWVHTVLGDTAGAHRTPEGSIRRLVNRSDCRDGWIEEISAVCPESGTYCTRHGISPPSPTTTGCMQLSSLMSPQTARRSQPNLGTWNAPRRPLAHERRHAEPVIQAETQRHPHPQYHIGEKAPWRTAI